MSKLQVGINDLATVNPGLAMQWHPTKNGNLTPSDVTFGSHKKIWWYLPYDVPTDYPIEHLRGKHFDFEWTTAVKDRNSAQSCPFLSGQAVWQGFNDLGTVSPKLAEQWHPVKNGDLIAEMVTCNSKKEIWWMLPYDVPMDYPIEHLRGKHFDFEWKADVNHRYSSGRGCPFLSGQSVWVGFNDFATTHPELAKEWHPTKNGNLKPTDVTAGSGKKVWWHLAYDVPMDYPIKHLRGKHFNFEWEAKILNRTINKSGCPYLDTAFGSSLWKGWNDLETRFPELVKEWHPTKNGNLKPSDVSFGSGKTVWWQYKHEDIKTGEIIKYEWKTTPNYRSSGAGCPFLFSSKGEQAVRKILIKNNIKFKEQHVFKDRFCLNKNNPLRDDFAIFDKYDKAVGTIEFHGQQHYEPVDFAGKGKIWAKEQFEITQQRDKVKTEYLKKHGIRQIIVPYTEFDNAEVIVNNFIDELSKDYDLFNTKEEKGVAEWVPPSQQSEPAKKDVKEFLKMIDDSSKTEPIKRTGFKVDLLARKDTDISI